MKLITLSAETPVSGDADTKILLLTRGEAYRIMSELLAALTGEPGGYNHSAVYNKDGAPLFRLVIALAKENVPGVG